MKAPVFVLKRVAVVVAASYREKSPSVRQPMAVQNRFIETPSSILTTPTVPGPTSLRERGGARGASALWG